MAAMHNDLSATEAARLLGVSLPTLYSYVSRGLLSSHSSGAARRKCYAQEEVLRLAARRNDAKRGGQTAVAAMHWGLPVLETHISHIGKGRLLYRGCDATALAGHASLEAVAGLLWDDGVVDYFHDEAPMPPAWPERAATCAPETSPLVRAMCVMPLLASVQLPSEMLRSGPLLMRTLASTLLQTVPSALPLHRQFAETWRADAQQTEWIRAAMVLLADHELNASTFAVRCVASTGASLPTALGAGLAALSGHKHGGGSAAARRMLAGALASASPTRFIVDFYRSTAPELAGFGHPLYPDGDPRAAYLLARLAAMTKEGTPPAAVVALCAMASETLDRRPNADLALAAMELACGWPPGASMSLFALARSAGWIAHAAEQAANTALIRPRARYVGRHQRA